MKNKKEIVAPIEAFPAARPGTVIVVHWGYDNANTTWYQIISVTSKTVTFWKYAERRNYTRKLWHTIVRNLSRYSYPTYEWFGLYIPAFLTYLQ